MNKKRLSNRIALRLVYQDETPFGSALTNRCDAFLRNACGEVLAYRQHYGLPQVIAKTRELLSAIRNSGKLDGIYKSSQCLSEKWLYPDSDKVKPVALQLEEGIGTIIATIPLGLSLSRDLAAYLGEWQWGASPPTNSHARTLWEQFESLGVLLREDKMAPRSQLGQATFIGHSTLRISDGDCSLLIDPFLLPKSSLYSPSDQPLTLDELGKPDAVFITHSHPDHFDLGTLLRLGSQVPIFVPEVVRESVLSIDMALRLCELGFRQVRSLRWFEEIRVGNLKVIALPFYGEQPTVAETLHPEIRNQGNIYLVEIGNKLLGLTADSGADFQGNVKQLASEVLARYGSLDTLFGGYRGFSLYPIQYLFSSVARYLPFVPDKSWQVRQKMMCDADDLIDLGEIWQAQRIVPYSDGGAPWYWLRGLGPCLDGSSPVISAIDPTPDSVVEVAHRRSGTLVDGNIPSPIPICLLSPGDFLEL